MTDRRNRLTARHEMADDVEHGLVEAQVLGSAATGNDERVVGSGIDVGERRVQAEVVSRFLGVRLVALEVMDGRLH